MLSVGRAAAEVETSAVAFPLCTGRACLIHDTGASQKKKEEERDQHIRHSGRRVDALFHYQMENRRRSGIIWWDHKLRLLRARILKNRESQKKKINVFDLNPPNCSFAILTDLTL
jgi:hypothetical protein